MVHHKSPKFYAILEKIENFITDSVILVEI